MGFQETARQEDTMNQGNAIEVLPRSWFGIQRRVDHISLLCNNLFFANGRISIGFPWFLVSSLLIRQCFCASSPLCVCLYNFVWNYCTLSWHNFIGSKRVELLQPNRISILSFINFFGVPPLLNFCLKTYPNLTACGSGPEARICILLVSFERKHFEVCGNVKWM